jgi:hypothetical protein
MWNDRGTLPPEVLREYLRPCRTAGVSFFFPTRNAERIILSEVRNHCLISFGLQLTHVDIFNSNS